MAERKPAKKGTQKSAKSTTATNKKSKGFTAEERAAMKERAQELKAEGRRADGEKVVLAKIAEMKGPDRAMAKRLHAIIKASAPALSPKTWYGMPAYAKDDKSPQDRVDLSDRGRGSLVLSPELGILEASRKPAAVIARVHRVLPCSRPSWKLAFIAQ
jgi:hypothetical protein